MRTIVIAGRHSSMKHDIGSAVAKRLNAVYHRLGVDYDETEESALDVWERHEHEAKGNLEMELEQRYIVGSYDYRVVTGVIHDGLRRCIENSGITDVHWVWLHHRRSVGQDIIDVENALTFDRMLENSKILTTEVGLSAVINAIVEHCRY